jgi:AraC-like DNA-binding protein
MRDFHGHEPSSGVPPPAWAERFCSDDLDQVRETIARRDGEHSRVAHGTGPLGYEVAWLQGELVSMAWARVALPTTIRGELPNVVLHLETPAGSRYRFGRREFLTGPCDALFVADHWEFTRCTPPGTSFALDLDKEALTEEVAARSAGRPGKPMLTTQRLDIDDASRARLNIALTRLLNARAPDAPIQPGVWRAEADVLGVIADLVLAQSAIVRTRATSARIDDLEGWIEANLERPITAGQLCRIAGVSKRGLEKIFESRRGMSPMRFVAERRLAAAHRMLSSTAAQGEDVTRVALGLGFNHAGRFSAIYRQTYGELPSQTLKRTVRRRG